MKKLGVRLGNWLTAEQGATLWQAPDKERLKGKRDRALLSLLLACGLRRHEVAELTIDHFQQREGHWAIVDLSGKGGHVRTVRFRTGFIANSARGSTLRQSKRERSSVASAALARLGAKA